MVVRLGLLRVRGVPTISGYSAEGTNFLQNVVDTSRPLTSRPILMVGGCLILLFIVTGYLATAKDVPSFSELAALPACIVLIIVFDRSPAIGALCVLISIPFGGIELPVLELTPKLF